MKDGMKVILVTSVVSLLLVAGFIAIAEVDENKAKQIFEAKCTTCHNGASAPNFQGVIDTITSWASKYTSLDEAVKSEYKAFGGAANFDQLMQQMKQFSGLTDEEYRLLYNYFKQVFEAAAKSLETKEKPQQTTTSPSTTTAPAASETKTTPETTVTVTVTITTTTTITRTPTKTVETPKPPKEAYTTPPHVITVNAWKTVKPYKEELSYTLETSLYLAVVLLVAGIALTILARYRPDIVPSRE